MLIEIIVTSIGALLSLVAIIGSVKAKNSTESLLSTNVRVSLGLTGIILIIYGGYSFGTFNLTGQVEQYTTGNVKQVSYPIEEVLITSPVEGDSVNCRILSMGVYPEQHQKDIWVLLRPSDGFYYPQSDHTNTSFKRNGKWQVITRFGGDKDEQFDVIAFESDSSASQFFSSTIQEWKDRLEYPGLEREELPAGASEVDRVTVSLKENCRGVF